MSVILWIRAAWHARSNKIFLPQLAISEPGWKRSFLSTNPTHVQCRSEFNSKNVLFRTSESTHEKHRDVFPAESVRVTLLLRQPPSTQQTQQRIVGGVAGRVVGLVRHNKISPCHGKMFNALRRRTNVSPICYCSLTHPKVGKSHVCGVGWRFGTVALKRWDNPRSG